MTYFLSTYPDEAVRILNVDARCLRDNFFLSIRLFEIEEWKSASEFIMIL